MGTMVMGREVFTEERRVGILPGNDEGTEVQSDRKPRTFVPSTGASSAEDEFGPRCSGSRV